MINDQHWYKSIFFECFDHNELKNHQWSSSKQSDKFRLGGTNVI